MCKGGIRLVFLLSFWDIIGNPVKFIADLIALVLDKILMVIADTIGKLFTDSLYRFTYEATTKESIFRLFGNNGPNLETLGQVIQIGAFTLATIFFMIRILNGMKDNLTGENPVNYSEVVGSFIVSCALIMAIPYVLDFMMSVNKALIETLSRSEWGGADLNFKKGAKFGDIVQINASGDSKDWARFIGHLFAFIAFIIMAFAGAIRVIELVILYLIGPLLAATYTNRSRVLTSFWTDSIAVIFTQSVHYLLLVLMLRLISNGAIDFSGDGAVNLLLAFGISLVALRGPQVIRQFLGNAGMGGTVSGMRKAGAAIMGSGRGVIMAGRTGASMVRQAPAVASKAAGMAMNAPATMYKGARSVAGSPWTAYKAGKRGFNSASNKMSSMRGSMSSAFNQARSTVKADFAKGRDRLTKSPATRKQEKMNSRSESN